MINEKQKSKISRFIAGAVCPSCGELDRIVIKEKDNISARHCVSCGFSEKKSEKVQSPSPNLKGRLERSAPVHVSPLKLDIINLDEK